ncbi:hypothetical protein EXE51_15820 [Halorubrum sp. CGM5_25_10-8B]|uniref:tetratricopeptide repeat protein n=1 Tax=Halorubrum sp. CGM5_25_10-8B TaxID=2518115 RepID=UPI0010F7D4E8|nr:hypothetical protein [Halorubrum sp. CGM5_25_10-8B]TKX35141.1 hypothetical protein EXE51_15820 [Halorubrum sp. CGM5_25_10-8B]
MNDDLILNSHLDTLASSGEVTDDDIIAFLQELPPEERIEHQVNLAKLIGQIPEVKNHLESILADDKPIDAECLDPVALRFAAFKALVTFHRRNKNITMLESLHMDYGHLFSERPMYNESYSVLLRVRGQPDDIYEAIDIQENVLEEVADNPGIYQAHANTITQAIEDGIISGSQREEYLEKARHSIDRAISLWRDYGKYHVTKGRILALQGRFDEGRRKIEQGIDLEDPEKDDYAIRIGQFQQHLLRTDFREYESQLQDRLDLAEDQLDSIKEDSEEVVDRLRNSMLQFLGFFTAIIAAIITTTQIATNYSPTAAGHLIVIIFGGLTASFGGLSIIIPKDDATRRGLYVTGLGILLIVGAMIPFYLL